MTSPWPRRIVTTTGQTIGSYRAQDVLGAYLITDGLIENDGAGFPVDGDAQARADFRRAERMFMISVGVQRFVTALDEARDYLEAYDRLLRRTVARRPALIHNGRKPTARRRHR